MWSPSGDKHTLAILPSSHELEGRKWENPQQKERIRKYSFFPTPGEVQRNSLCFPIHWQKLCLPRDLYLPTVVGPSTWMGNILFISLMQNFQDKIPFAQLGPNIPSRTNQLYPGDGSHFRNEASLSLQIYSHRVWWRQYLETECCVDTTKIIHFSVPFTLRKVSSLFSYGALFWLSFFKAQTADILN